MHLEVNLKNMIKKLTSNLIFKKYFNNYINKVKVFTDKKELANYKLPYFNPA